MALLLLFGVNGLAGAAAETVSSQPNKGELGSCVEYAGLPVGTGEAAGMAFVPSGGFMMGSDRHQPEERFPHLRRVDGFWIDRHEVTNAQFREFVEATGYRRLPSVGLDPESTPAHRACSRRVRWCSSSRPRAGGQLTQWWQYVDGANWRAAGRARHLDHRKENHPVVHVAYEDALAYARWLGRELPTEAQWEFAARGGATAQDDWTSAFDPDGKPIANTWQGLFPVLNTEEDGYAGTAPVGCFPPNGYGLYDMIGNVWEWTSDWYRPAIPASRRQPERAGSTAVRISAGATAERVIKGGSYLCAPNYCARYRPAARQPQEAESRRGHLGFRTVLNRPMLEGSR